MKKFIIIVCVIAAICFLGYIGQNKDLSNLGGANSTSSGSNVITGKNSQTTSSTANNKSNNSSTKNTSTDNTASENKDNKDKNNEVNNTTGNESNNTENTTNNQEPAQEEVTTSDEDKAKALAQKTYGTSDGVYFRVEQVESNGVYIISVRDNETTRDLAWYKVNVKDGTVKQ